MPLQQIRKQANKLLSLGFFGKDAKHIGSFVLIIFFFSFLTLAPVAHASQTNGTISSTYKYAWSNVGGYINFAPTTSTVSVTDTGLSGYVWSENDGWINLSPSNGGVTNTVNGVLGGFAWDSLKGWVSFTGVTIDSSGRFHGKAVGTNETISFDCTHCDVRTDWRPVSARVATVTNNGSLVPVTGGSNAPNPLPGAHVSSTKVTQLETPTQYPLSNTVSGSRTSHSSGSSAQALQALSTHSTFIMPNTGNVANAQSTTSTTTTQAPITAAPTITSASLLSTAAYVGGGLLLLLLIIFFATRFFL